MQASGFEEKEARDCPACLLSPGIREDPGSSVSAQGVWVYCTGSSWVGAQSSQGSSLGVWRVFLEQGSPRAVGRTGGKAWRHGVRKEGRMEESRCHPECIRKKRLSRRRPQGRETLTCARGRREGEQKAEASALLPLLHCWGLATAHISQSGLFPTM